MIKHKITHYNIYKNKYYCYKNKNRLKIELIKNSNFYISKLDIWIFILVYRVYTFLLMC